MQCLPCPLCSDKLDKRISRKNGKPYFVCNPCGIQLFIRKQKGIELLEEVFRNIDKASVPFTIHAKNLYEIQALLKEINGVEAEIRKLGVSYFFSDEKSSIRTSLKKRLKNLLVELKQMAQEVKHEA